MFVDGEPVAFLHSKTKELLAYLVDRGGAFCTNGDIIATLWENEANDSKKKAYLRKLRAEILSVFRFYGAEDALCHQRGLMAIVPSKIYCDYFLFKTR